MNIPEVYNWKKELKEAGFIFLGGGLLNTVILCPGCLEDSHLFLVNFFYSAFFWVFLAKGSEYLVAWLDPILPWLKYPIYRTLASVGAVVAYTFVVVWGLDLFFDLVIFGKTWEQTIERTGVPVLNVVLVTLVINLFMHGRGFLMAWREAAVDIERLKTEQVSTQYKSLKNQVNPHFLFNSLNVLSSLVYEDQEKAVEFIRKLSEVYRYVLESKDEEVVPLEREMGFVSNFTFLQKIRFGDNLQLIVDEIPANFYVPPLAIQVLVENAIKHNVVSEKDPLHIHIRFERGYCFVKNSLKEKKSKDSTGIGLKNLKDRYKYLTDREVIVDKDEKSFQVGLPLLTINEHEVHNN